jgi:5-methylcytosine-specific restriction endonuclease McrA
VKTDQRRTTNRESDERRRANKPWRAWYSTSRWRRRRAAQLAAEPLCQRCRSNGLVEPATVAHHIVKHDGDHDLFWLGDLRSSCAPCHDIIEQGIEARGYEVGCDSAGRPIAADHPWNRAK